MPAAERIRILEQVATEPWAAEEMARLERDAVKDGYAAALLFALRGGEAPLAVARAWLLAYAKAGGDIPMAREKLGDDEFFRGGQPWIGPVYYNIDARPLLAYDWIHSGLDAADRARIEEGILTSARFRRRCMDRWTQTPNLVFKPTIMVALAGIVTGDRELAGWGLLRKPGSPLGGYFPVLDTMLDADGPWREAPIYAVAHRSLALMGAMSRRLAFLGQRDAFSTRAAGGGSPRLLMDSYLATAYPPETDAKGRRRIRVFTYGDGATSASGDLFLVGARPKGDLSLSEALEESWSASGDPRYAAFLALAGGYRASFPDRPALPAEVELPPAPSSVWRSFGLAFLRSDESPRYWETGDAMAASLLMSRGYGHDHRDKMGITFFGAGRLLYPDWNHEQYENPAVGWTRNTIAHNALMVDEEDARDAEPLEIRSDLTSDAKRVYVETEGVFEGVRQGRALVLTQRYLLDVVSARSASPRTYDWLIHVAAGQALPTEGRLRPAPPLGPRFARLRPESSVFSDEAWSQAFAAGDARVRVTMAPAPGTQVVHGRGYDGNAMLVVRRDQVEETAFVAVHEPFRADAAPAIRDVRIVDRRAGELLVRVQADAWSEEHWVPSVSVAAPAPKRLSDLEIRAADLRFPAGGGGLLELAVRNRSQSSFSGTIELVLPIELVADRDRLAVESLPPNAEMGFTVRLSARTHAPGRSSLTAAARRAGSDTRIAATTIRVWRGPTLHPDYRSDVSPRYRIEAPRFRAALDMRHGMIRSLIDESGRDRLAGRPLFTFGVAGGEALLSEATEKAFTWPSEAPASVLAEVEAKARYRVGFSDDRLEVTMDAGWTRAERVAFRVPGEWSADPSPTWGDRRESDGRLAAIELDFPGSEWNLCFAFTPPQLVSLEGTGMRFEIGGSNGDAWSAGFCRRDGLPRWAAAAVGASSP